MANQIKEGFKKSGIDTTKVYIYVLLESIQIMNLRLTTLLAVIFHLVIVTNIKGQIIMSPGYKFDIYKTKPSTLNSGRTQHLADVTDRQITRSFDYNNLMILPDSSQKAELIASNNNFDVYKLPMDNMPCLVPDKYFHGNMNTMQQVFNKRKEFDLNDKIPNALKKLELIPLTK